MDDNPKLPKIFREFDITDRNGLRVDFFTERGLICSAYDQYITILITVGLMALGYEVEDYPEVGETK